jgi:hypothetical protein
LQKQKKKEEKAATQAPAMPVETTLAAPEVQPLGDSADKAVDSIEEVSKAESAGDGHTAAENSGDADVDADERAGSAVFPPNEVGLYLSIPSSLSQTPEMSRQCRKQNLSLFCLARMKMIVAARASERGVHLISPYILTNPN